MSLKNLFTRASQGSPDFGGAFVDPVLARLVQARLNALGAQPPLSVDGDFGSLSGKALSAFQQAHSLTVTGNPDPATLAALGVQAPPAAKVPVIPGLKPSVVAAFPVFSGKFEGQALPYPYTDVKGLVTVGTGNLIEPKSKFQSLPWQNPDGSPSTPDQTSAAYDALKAAWPATQSVASQKVTNIRLSQDALNNLLYGTLTNDHNFFKNNYAGYTSAPADAQMGVHSLAWAWGPGFAHVWDTLGLGNLGTQFKAAFDAHRFDLLPDIISKASAHEEHVNKGIGPRDAATKQLFQNAADVVAKKANPDALYFPGNVSALAMVAGTSAIMYLVGIPLAGFIAWAILKGRK